MKRNLLDQNSLLMPWLTACRRIGITIIGLLSLVTGTVYSQDILWGTTTALGPFGEEGAGTVFSLQSTGADFTVHKAFKNPPKFPSGSLVLGSDGYFYGMTREGGSSEYGTVFKINSDSSDFTVLKNFNNSDGANPYGSLVQGRDGFFYGMTHQGGSNGKGTVFKIAANGSGFTVLKSFNPPSDGANPYGSLVQGRDGMFYGMTRLGGSYGKGTVFKVGADGSGFMILRNFNSTDGAHPYGSLVQGSEGLFYGMTREGGSGGFGTIFKIGADGSGFSIIKNFNSLTDGTDPWGSLVLGRDGYFYGMAREGGINDHGTVFKINADGSSFSVLKRFNFTDGADPVFGGLVQGRDGFFYGMTREGGSNGKGTVFKIAANGSGFTVLKNFNPPSDGANPFGGLVEGRDGYFYGLTEQGGSIGNGTVFKIGANGSGFSTIKNFNAIDGSFPFANLVQGKDGLFYGMAWVGGSYDYGTVFKISGNGSGFTTLKSFHPATDGGYPSGGLVQGNDDLFYGMTWQGGNRIYGTVFRIGADGSGFTTLKSFNITDGAFPTASLVQSSDGYFYGMTLEGGIISRGTVFRIGADGSGFTVLRSFTPSTDGAFPLGSLVEGSDGFFYGTTRQGGRNGNGTVFKISRDGSDFIVLRNFNAADGSYPPGSLVQGSDGFFYGVTRDGGSNGKGTVFKIGADGSGFMILRNFNSTDGAHPHGSLVQGSEGLFYGMTREGGSSGHGTIFKIGADGSGFSIIKNFNSSTDGAYPQGSLVIQCFPPTVSFTVDAVCEGTATALKDASTHVAANATYAWDINHDGTVDYTTKGNITHTYPAAGTYTAKLTIRQGNCEQSFTQQVIVKALPTATLTGDATICAGASTDLDIALTGTGPWRVIYTDGITQTEVTADSSPIEISVSPAGTTTYSLVSVSDANCTRPVSGSATVTVNTPPGLTVPDIGTVNNDAGECGAWVAFAAKTTGKPASVITYRIGQMDIKSPFYFPVGTTTLTATATNICGTEEETFTVTVQDKQPPIFRHLPVDITLGSEAGKCGAAVSWIGLTATDNCSDVVPVYSHAPGSVFPVGTTTVTYTATDAAGNTASGSFNITITNTDPFLNAIDAPGAPVPVNTAVSASASFTDDNLEIATWDWGDGQTSAGNIGSNSLVSGDHNYTAPGVYTITLTVQDLCGKTAERSFRYVVIYEPGGSFVTGGGWINSPAGAFVADPAVTGKASFGFVAKYPKGAGVPTASTEFKFKAGDLNFHSRSYEWLVVAGAKAQFKGEGTINGAGAYSFLLSAIDGQVSGGGGPDMIRIKIWDKVSGALVYDNNRGNSDNAALTTTLGGGSIMIHGGAGSTRLASLPQAATASANLKAYPNPFRDKTTVEFSFDQEQDYSLAVYDLKGSLIKTLLAGKAPAGEQVQAVVEAAGLPVGVYFIRLTTRDGMKHLRILRE